MKNFLYYLFCILVCFNGQTLLAKTTLQDAVQSAYEKNPEIKAEEHLYQATRSSKIKSIGGFLPKVYADVNNGHQQNKISGNGAATRNNIDKRSITLSQELFSGGKTFFDVKRSENVVNKQKAIFDDKVQNVILGTVKAYIDILKYQELLKLAEESAAIQEELANYTAKKISVKDATKSEVAKAKADQIAAFNNKNTAQNNLSAAKVDLYRYTLISYNNLDPIEQIDKSTLFSDVKVLDTKKLFKTAIESNPNLKSAKYSFEASKYNSSVAKSSLSPTVSLNMESSENKNSIYFNNHTQTNQSIYLNLHVPIFNSGTEYSDISIANEQEKQEKYNYHNTRNSLYNLISDQVIELKNLDSQYDSMNELESANNTYFLAVKQEEKFGTKSIIDVLRAKQDLYDAKASRINVYYDMLFSMFKLKAMLGELSAMFISESQED